MSSSLQRGNARVPPFHGQTRRQRDVSAGCSVAAVVVMWPTLLWLLVLVLLWPRPTSIVSPLALFLSYACCVFLSPASTIRDRKFRNSYMMGADNLSFLGLIFVCVGVDVVVEADKKSRPR